MVVHSEHLTDDELREQISYLFLPKREAAKILKASKQTEHLLKCSEVCKKNFETVSQEYAIFPSMLTGMP